MFNVYFSENNRLNWINIILHFIHIFVFRIIFCRLLISIQSEISQIQVYLTNFQIIVSKKKKKNEILTYFNTLDVFWLYRYVSMNNSQSIMNYSANKSN